MGKFAFGKTRAKNLQMVDASARKLAPSGADTLILTFSHKGRRDTWSGFALGFKYLSWLVSGFPLSRE